MGINRIKYVEINSELKDFVEFNDISDVTESITITQNGVYYSPKNIAGYNKVIVDVPTGVIHNQDITITTNGEYHASEGYDGFGTVVVEVPEPTFETLYATENGTYTPTADGYSSVEVDVQPLLQNIRVTQNGEYTAGTGYDGLGTVTVEVSDIPAVVEPLSITPTTSPQSISAPQGLDGYNPITVAAVTSAIDSNIQSQNIVNGVTILGVTGSADSLIGSTETVIPTTSQQIITPTSPSNGFTSVTVNAVTSAIDPNIIPGNIRDGATILGVTGNVAGGGIMFEKDQNDVLKKKATLMSFLGATDIGNHVLENAYSYSSVSGSLDLSSLTKITGNYACKSAFESSLITSVNMSNVEKIEGIYSCAQMFKDSALTSLNLNKIRKINGTAVCNEMFCGNTGLSGSNSLNVLTEITGNSACYDMFYGCTSLSDGSLSAVEKISGAFACRGMFSGCSSIVGGNFWGFLEEISGDNACYQMYNDCRILVEAVFYVLHTIMGSNTMSRMFENNPRLPSVSFPLLDNSSIENVNCLSDMCVGCNNVTFHFPSNVQTTVEGLIGYSTTAPFGATAGTVLFDLPPTVELLGTSGNVYVRNPLWDTSNALGWKKSTSAYIGGFTTPGLTIPQVGDTINTGTITDTIQSITYL